LSFAPTILAQDESRYRIEILVLRHLNSEAVPRELDSLRDFSLSLDLTPLELDPAEEDSNADEQSEREEVIAAAETEEGAALPEDPDLLLIEGEDAPIEDEEPWAEVVLVETMGPEMQDAWRRLRLSAPFRPEQYLAWEQAGEEPFPALRVHNRTVVLVDDPYADLRAELAAAAEEAALENDDVAVFSDLGDDLAGEETDEGEEEPGLPDPSLFFQIDGTATLTRTRFLHLNLDLEFRTAAFDENIQEISTEFPSVYSPSLVRIDGEETEIKLPAPPSFQVHRLKQSRQIKTRRMEYFDTPFLGVLAFITEVEVPEEAEADL
jgi:hypothetical protein